MGDMDGTSGKLMSGMVKYGRLMSCLQFWPCREGGDEIEYAEGKMIGFRLTEFYM